MQDFFDDLKDNFLGNPRLTGLKQLAKANKFQFRRKESFAKQPYQLKGFELFKGKNGKRLKGILQLERNTSDYHLRCYDYIYDGNSKTWKTTVFELFDKQLNLPYFEIRPKGAIKKVKEFFVEDERLFPQAINFHTKYELITEEAEDLRFVLNSSMLEAIAEEYYLSVEGEGDYLLMYCNGKVIEPERFFHYYSLFTKLIDRLINGHSEEGFV